MEVDGNLFDLRVFSEFFDPHNGTRRSSRRRDGRSRSYSKDRQSLGNFPPKTRWQFAFIVAKLLANLKSYLQSDVFMKPNSQSESHET